MGRRVTGITIVGLIAGVASACGGSGIPPEGLPEGTGAAGFAAATLHLSNSQRFLARTSYAATATTPKGIQAHLRELRGAVQTFDLTFVELDRRAARGKAGSTGVVLRGWDSLLRLSAETRRRNQALMVALADPLTLQAHECDLAANQQVAQRHVAAMDAVVGAAHEIEKTFDVTTEYDRVVPGDAAAQRAESTVAVAVLCLDAIRMASTAAAPAAKTTTARAGAKPRKQERADLQALDDFVREGVSISAPGQLIDAREALLAYVAAAQEPATPVAEGREHRALLSLREILTRVRLLLG
ncbi:MAG: hypothetical protein QOE98_2631 [Gaiellaceae bacterium]|nr:hypothetical protein [Gaiellaceae bacterium]